MVHTSRQVALASVPFYQLEERDGSWLALAPLVVSNEVSVPASSTHVFAVLADIANWHTWCTGVTETDVVGPLTTGIGAKRKVKAGGIRFEEVFVNLGGRRAGHLLGSDHVRSGVPLTSRGVVRVPDLADPSKSVLTQTMGVALSGTLRPLAGVIRWYLQRATRRGA